MGPGPHGGEGEQGQGDQRVGRDGVVGQRYLSRGGMMECGHILILVVDTRTFCVMMLCYKGIFPAVKLKLF